MGTSPSARGIHSRVRAVAQEAPSSHHTPDFFRNLLECPLAVLSRAVGHTLGTVCRGRFSRHGWGAETYRAPSKHLRPVHDGRLLRRPTADVRMTRWRRIGIESQIGLDDHRTREVGTPGESSRSRNLGRANVPYRLLAEATDVVHRCLAVLRFERLPPKAPIAADAIPEEDVPRVPAVSLGFPRGHPASRIRLRTSMSQISADNG